MNIKEIIRDNVANFVSYRCQVAYYGIVHGGTRYVFPVPLKDVGGATLEASEKAIFMMRYLRKAIAESTLTSELL